MLHTNGLSYSYDSQHSLSFPDLSIERGQHTLIIGPSGCGKTTLLHMLAGLRRPDRGSVSILDQDITKMTQAKLDQFRGEHIGMIFQVPHFVRSLNVLDNLTLAQSLAGGKVDKAKCSRLLDQLNLSGKESKRHNALSVGEQQRVAIVRSLVNDPAVIFADEPTSALDDANTDQVIELLKTQADEHGATLVVVTHDQRLKDNFNHQVSL